MVPLSWGSESSRLCLDVTKMDPLRARSPSDAVCTGHSIQLHCLNCQSFIPKTFDRILWPDGSVGGL